MLVARRFLVSLEPIVSSVFWNPEPYEELAALGITDVMAAYFLGRAAAMGAVSPDTVVATFFNFNPELVRRSVEWDTALPEVVLEARMRGVRRALQRLLAEDDGTQPDLARATELLRAAAGACRPEGRALYAAWAALPWPADDVGALWHAGNLLREYRGDGHLAVLLAHEVDAVEALLLHAPYSSLRADRMLGTRQWSDEDYAAARDRLAARGFVEADGSLTQAGEKFRDMIELETDKLAAPPWRALGTERCEELLAILEPLSLRVVERKGAPRFSRSIAPVPQR